MGEGKLIDDDEMFTLTYDDLGPSVSDEVAIARGDRPPEDSLEKPVEVILPEDREEKEELQTDETDEPDGDADTGDTNDDSLAVPEKNTPKDIPYGRFSEKLKEIDNLKDEIARLKADREQAAPPAPAAVPAKPAFDLDAKYLEHANLVADGETEAAARVMREIDAFKEAEVETRLIRVINQREARSRAETIVNDLLDKHQDFFADEINRDLFDGAKVRLINKGYSLDQALTMAAERFFARAETPVADLEKKEEEIVDPEKEALEKIRNEQKQRTIEKNAKAATHQPNPVTGGRGARQTPTFKPNALTMTAAERKAMSDIDKRRARGDFV